MKMSNHNKNGEFIKRHFSNKGIKGECAFCEERPAVKPPQRAASLRHSLTV